MSSSVAPSRFGQPLVDAPATIIGDDHRHQARAARGVDVFVGRGDETRRRIESRRQHFGASRPRQWFRSSQAGTGKKPLTCRADRETNRSLAGQRRPLRSAKTQERVGSGQARAISIASATVSAATISNQVAIDRPAPAPLPIQQLER